MSFNEERVQLVVEEVEFQMETGEESEADYLVELLHDPFADKEELNEKIMENLSEEMIEALTDDDLREVRRRLRKAIKPEPEPEEDDDDEEFPCETCGKPATRAASFGSFCCMLCDYHYATENHDRGEGGSYIVVGAREEDE